jgi:hypothetical protein
VLDCSCVTWEFVYLVKVTGACYVNVCVQSTDACVQVLAGDLGSALTSSVDCFRCCCCCCRFSHPRIQVVRNWQEVEAAVLTMAAVEAVPQ